MARWENILAGDEGGAVGASVAPVEMFSDVSGEEEDACHMRRRMHVMNGACPNVLKCQWPFKASIHTH